MHRSDVWRERLSIPRSVLADRLQRRVLQGVLEKRPYQKEPVRFEYRLTEAGAALYPVVLAMHGWSQRWLVAKDEAPLTLIDRSSGEAIAPVVCDRDSGEPLNPRRIRWNVEAVLPA